MRAVIYTRISNDKEGLSLGVDRQEKDCRKLAKSRGWEVVAVYSDNDISASGKKARPGWEALLRDLETDGIEAVVAYSSSRMYRRPADLQRLIDVVRAKNIDIGTVASGNIDLTTADGRMMAGLLATIDQGELERVSERVSRKQAELRDSGYFTGGYRPFGYNIEDQGKGKRLVVNEYEAALIQDAARAILNGTSVGAVVRDWTAKGVVTTGGKMWTKSHVKSLLTRDLTGILTKTDSKAVIDLFESRAGTFQMRRGKYLLTGLLECGRCGGKMGGRPAEGKARYVCIASGPMHLVIPAGPVDDLVCSMASEVRQTKKVDLHDPSDAMLAERESLVAEMEATAASDLPLDALKVRTKKIQEAIDALDEELSMIGSTVDIPFESILPLDELGAEKNPAVRAYLETLIERITVSPGRGDAAARVTIEWRDGVEAATEA